jgi:DNA-binding HxlR family transcriptional regulator
MDAKLIPSTVVEALGRGGAQEFDDLLKQVQKYQSGINETEFSRLLMEMEIQGLVRVTKMAKGKRRIELA